MNSLSGRKTNHPRGQSTDAVKEHPKSERQEPHPYPMLCVNWAFKGGIQGRYKFPTEVNVYSTPFLYFDGIFKLTSFVQKGSLTSMRIEVDKVGIALKAIL